MGPCGNNSQFGFPEGRFRMAETKLKPQGGFKPSLIAFAQVNKRGYKKAKIGLLGFNNAECSQMAPRILSVYACIVAVFATMQA